MVIIGPEIKARAQIEVKFPNEVTAETLRKSEEGKELHKVNSVAGLFRELERGE